MHIAVVVNGDLPAGSDEAMARICRRADAVIAVDGGLAHCALFGVTPDMVVGDLDSADAGLVAAAIDNGAEVRAFPTDKDATDLELALDCAVEAGAGIVTVVAPFGGRLDHELATVGLLASERFANLQIEATDGRRRLWVIRTIVELALPRDTTVSLVPMTTEVTGVTTTGLQWPLDKATLAMGTTHGVSNLTTGSIQSVEITGGVLLAVVG